MTTTRQGLQARARRLLEILELEAVEQNLYLGQNEARSPFRLFGGQVLAQAAMAAYRTVADVHLHSLHAYFLRAGSAERPVLYEVERIRDGRSFTTRRVVAIQNGQAIFNVDASFQRTEPGFEHADPMPNVPLPDELEDDVTVAMRLEADDPQLSPMAKIARPFETRSVFALGSPGWADSRYWNPAWIRFREPLEGGDSALARCLLAYASDMSVVSTASLPHQQELGRDALQMASLDHALWIHRPPSMDQWLLFHRRTSNAQGARGMVHADFFSAQGQLIASVTQEGLLRRAKPG
jgi:acyl-CoA thioesterase-2